MTPLLRVLVAMPNRGDCSSRKTSSIRSESSYAMAQPTTPPPMITTLTRSIERESARNGDLQIRDAAHLSCAVARRHGAAKTGERRYASWTRSREARLKHLRVAGNIACLSPVPPAAAEVVVGPHCD